MTLRPPIVVVLGHVDHGKTTLLDYIRKTQVTSKEHGGITQKIGAYEVITSIKGYHNNKIVFVDTPGHEAFSRLRARGANIADIAVLIIDAKDSIMPQTIESIAHIKSAKIPYIVAVNKIDLPEANLDRVKRDLIKQGVIIEEKGSRVPLIPVSAKTGKGINELLETILLLASELNLSFNPLAKPEAYIIETKKDRRGTIVSAIIKNGQLKIGDTVYAQDKQAKIRSMISDKGLSLSQVFPSTPIELLGFEELPEVGFLISSQSQAREENNSVQSKDQLPFDINAVIGNNKEEKKISLILKADSQGSIEAVADSLAKNPNIELILKTVGNIYKSDVFLAKTTKAIIIGFNVDYDSEIKSLAKQEKVIIKTYNIIYELLEELTEATNLLKEKEEKERNLKGEAKVLATFIIEKEKVFGVKVIKGKINLGDNLQIYRNNNLLGKTKLVSLKIRAKSVNEVKKDQEAGMILSPQLDISIGDMVKCIS